MDGIRDLLVRLDSVAMDTETPEALKIRAMELYLQITHLKQQYEELQHHVS